MVVRQAVADDVQSIGEIQVRAWQSAYRGEFPDEYLDELRGQERSEYWGVVFEKTEAFGSRLIVVELDEAVVGFACFGPANEEPGRGELYAMNVDPERWRQGIGSMLLHAVSSQLAGLELPDALLWTGAKNDRAQSFYKSHGWSLDGLDRTQDVDGVPVAEVRLAKILK